jgi:hypothetical protein
MFGQVGEDLQQIIPSDAPTVISTERVDVPAGATRRVSPSLGGMVAVLAPPSPTNSGKTITLIIESPAGELKVVASPHVGADGKVTQTLINDATQATFTLAGVVTFTSNGVDSWKTPAEVPVETAVSPVGLALLGALDATYHLQTANPVLPSGRVVVASPDIVPDYTVPGQVSFRAGQAAQGRSGMPARHGEDGRRGFPGTQGARGTDGAHGRPGRAGEDGRTGRPGADGRAGPMGQQGPPGRRAEEWRRPFFAGASDGLRDVLARNNNSGPFNPHIDTGQYIGFGAEASLPASGQIRSSAPFTIDSADGTAGALLLRAATAGASVSVEANDTFTVTCAALVVNATTSASIDAPTISVAGTAVSFSCTAGPLVTNSVGRGFLRIADCPVGNIPAATADEGALWVENTSPTKLKFKDDEDANWDVGYACVSVNTTTPTATNAATNLSCGGSFTVPADTWRAGTLYRFTGYGVFVHTAAATPTITIELLINGAVVTGTVLTPIATAATYTLDIVGYIRCQTVGAGGTVVVAVSTNNTLTAVIAEQVGGTTGTGTTAIDTTVDRTIEMRCRMTTAVASNTLTVVQGFVERLA